jgi:hypothetical protein
MESFKQLLESNERFDLFNAIAGRIKLDKDAHERLLPKADKSKRFRHSTNVDGAIFLSNNKDKNIQISASEIKKICGGIETDGSVIVSLTGNPVVWFPTDAFTYRGESGVRWMDWSSFDYSDKLLDSKHKWDYYEKLMKILNKYPDLIDSFGTSNSDALIKTIRGNLDWRYFGSQFSRGGIFLSKQISDWKNNNPKQAKVLLNLILSMQKKWLTAISKKLAPQLSKNYADFKSNIQSSGFSSYDEAVVDNVEVKNLYIKEAFGLANRIQDSKWDFINGVKKPFAKEMKTSSYGSFSKLISALPKNIPFTFLDTNCSGADWNKLLKGVTDKWQEDADKWKSNPDGEFAYAWEPIVPKPVYQEFLDYFGIKEHRRSGGLQWYVVK